MRVASSLPSASPLGAPAWARRAPSLARSGSARALARVWALAIAAIACGPGTGPSQPAAGASTPRSPTTIEIDAPPAVEIAGSTGDEAPAATPALVVDPTIRWIAAGGGSTPESNQHSIEQDLALAAEVFGGGGLILFAGGPGSEGVQVQDPAPRGDPVLAALAELFAPRGGRDAHYRRTTLDAAGPASADEVLGALRGALAGPGAGPLIFYIAGHGDIGESPRDNAVGLWGQGALRVHELAEVVDAGARPLALVVTTCFSGGFAELAFAGADPRQGAAPGDRCGLFAATWDLEASGCDPSPDRRAHEGYGIHFLHALRGEDREGAPLPTGSIDLDGDGVVTLLEAHTRARIAGAGLDVPTTTSERWLREVAPGEGPLAPWPTPEDDAVVAHLGVALGIAGRPDAARTELERIEAEIDGRNDALVAAQADEDAAYRRAAATILSRWPVLDDPWHPDFSDMFARQRGAIAEHLERDPALVAYREARAAVDHLHLEIGDLRGSAARYERLARAQESRLLAGRLARRGGPEWAHYRRLLACERTPWPAPRRTPP
ncbi:MAG: hypothetical protein R3B09_15670 [Nannocystaceae bacterium]